VFDFLMFYAGRLRIKPAPIQAGMRAVSSEESQFPSLCSRLFFRAAKQSLQVKDEQQVWRTMSVPQ
jgi:hypothetical protein